MNPQQPQNPYGPAPGQFPGAPHTPNPNDYEFILSSQKPARGLRRSGGSKKKLLWLTSGLVAILLVVGLVGLLSRGGGTNFDLLTKVALEQTEIVRVANLALAQTGANQETNNLAMNVSLTVNSDLTQLKQYMSKNGHALDEKQLASGKNSETDDKLSAANTSGNFDDTYSQVLKDQLATYRTTLQSAYQATSGPNGQQVLSHAYDNVELLIKQLK